MIIIKIHFLNPINSSLQVGDIVFASPVNLGVNNALSQSFHTSVGSEEDNSTMKLGVVKSIQASFITVDISTGSSQLNSIDISNQIANHFISFAKNIAVNEAGLKGYYADVKLVNTSREKTELFSVSSDVAPSSK